MSRALRFLQRLAPRSLAGRWQSATEPAAVKIFDPFRVGYVPEHFSTPLHFAQKHHGLGAKLVPFPSGTGHMVAALQSREIDVALGLTEGWIAAMGRALMVGKDAGFRLVGTYVQSPLCWSISTGAKRDDITAVADLKGKTAGVSRMGSGSHVMAYVLAHAQKWLDPASSTPSLSSSSDPSLPSSDPFYFEPLDNFANLRAAVNEGSADFFLWEHFTSKKYYDDGSIKKVGEIYSPWESWTIVAAEPVLKGYTYGRRLPQFGDPQPLKLDHFFDRLEKGVQHFEKHPDEAVKHITTEMDYSDADAREWMKTVRFRPWPRGVSMQTVSLVLSSLRNAGVLNSDGSHADPMVAWESSPSGSANHWRYQ